MAARKLAVNIVVRNAKGVPQVFTPADEVPDWAAVQVTNDQVWASGGGDSSEAVDGDTPPPMAGRGSGRDAWVAYAEANGVGVTDDMSRDDIVKACELAEIPVS